LKPVVKRLQEYLDKNYHVKLINDFLTEDPQTFQNQKPDTVFMLENIRYYPEEGANDRTFIKKLAALADVFVNDAFGVSHRSNSSVTGVPEYLPSYGGLLLKKEIQMISKVIDKPKKPLVAIIGGAKISSKISLIGKLTEIADYLLIGGGLANTFLCAHEYNIGKSFCEYEEVQQARKLLFLAARKHTAIILPDDVVVAANKTSTVTQVRKVDEVQKNDSIFDIGPETQAKFGAVIAKAKTIIWNGPVGLTENPQFKRGTDFIYYAITQNTDSTSIVGGGDTLAAISKKEYLDKITHISTGGGAMLEFIEKGNLPGIEALEH
jgi:phosphoglycerate kinase